MAILLCEEVVISGIDKASDVSLSKTESCIFSVLRATYICGEAALTVVVVVVGDFGVGVYKPGAL